MTGSRRFRYLISSAGVVGAFWLFDLLAGAPQETKAQASGAKDLTLAAEDRTAEVEAALGLFDERQSPRLSPDQVTLPHDPFEPDERWKAALMAAQPPTVIAPVDPAAGEVAPETPPAVQGVMTGAPALVIIGGRAYPVGAIVDGWTVMRIDRDSVVLERDGAPTRVSVGPMP
ncbi:MAG: hypothetical protein KDA32_11815 [Phycisphaerales bacterium]|nr:hypothetical protein [Phycisphaerales bacterium]